MIERGLTDRLTDGQTNGRATHIIPYETLFLGYNNRVIDFSPILFALIRSISCQTDFKMSNYVILNRQTKDTNVKLKLISLYKLTTPWQKLKKRRKHRYVAIIVYYEQWEHIRLQLWSRYSRMVNQLMMASVNFKKGWFQHHHLKLFVW